jgi:hypothetical protein
VIISLKIEIIKIFKLEFELSSDKILRKKEPAASEDAPKADTPKAK